MPASQVGATTTATASTSTAFGPALPQTPTVPNLMLLGLSMVRGSAPSASVAGYTLIGTLATVVNASQTFGMALYYRIATASETAPAITWAGTSAVAALSEWAGIDSTTPLDTTPATGGTSATTNNGTVSEAVTPSAGSWQVGMGGLRSGAAPSTWTRGGTLPQATIIELAALGAAYLSMYQGSASPNDGSVGSSTVTFTFAGITSSPVVLDRIYSFRLAAPSAGGAGALALGGSVAAQAGSSPAGALTLGGSAAPTSTATASGALALGGSAAPAARPVTLGALTLGGTATATSGAGAATASGALTLGATATEQAQPTAAAALTLGGATTEQASATAAAALALGGSAADQARPVTAGALALTGSVVATATPGAVAALSLSGAVAGQARPVTAGVITLSSSATPAVAASAAGVLSLAATVTVTVHATTVGVITLAGTGNAQPSGPIRNLTVTATVQVGRALHVTARAGASIRAARQPAATHLEVTR